MLNLKNTLDGYLKNVEVIGNTVQDTNNLADIRSVGDKVEGQELYKIDVVSCGKNLFDGKLEQGSFSYDGSKKADFVGEVRNVAPVKVTGGSNIHFTSNINANLIVWEYNSLGVCESASPTSMNTNRAITLKQDTCTINFRVVSNDTDIILQVEEGTVATEYEPYKENKLEILSPVQLEKVGNVADRIICKDGVWGIDKYVKHINTKTLEIINYGMSTEGWFWFRTANGIVNIPDVGHFISTLGNGCVVTDGKIFRFLETAGMFSSLDDFKLAISNGVDVLYSCVEPQFIILPHDQQVKLRTFAGQTNIAFLTEIPGQIKAQVPKSLGATVNTHTEQIADLHNSLERVKKLEETTVSTIETESNFTTVNETSNGYFEDVKLEGKTLVNLCTNKSNWGGNISVRYSNIYLNRNFELNKIYTLCVVNPPTNFDNMMFRYDVDNTIFRSIKNTVATFKLSNILEVSPVIYLYGENLGEATNTQIIILEGDHIQNPPEYFEGLMSVGQDVEEVSVESANKNLFNGNVKNQTVNTNGMIASDEKARSTDFIKVPNDYDITISVKLLNQDRCAIVEYDANKQFIKFNNATSLLSNGVYTFKTDKNTKYIIYYYNSSTQIADGDIPNYIMVNVGTELNPYILYQSNKKPLLYYNPTTETWEKPILREYDTIEKHSDGKYYYHQRSEEVDYISGDESLTDCITDMNKTVKKISTEKVYECTNIDLMTYSGETNYIINSGAISPKSLLKVHNNISNVVKILQEKVSLLENTFIAGLKSVLSGDMYSLATILYPEDFEQNDNTEQDIMVIPE